MNRTLDLTQGNILNKLIKFSLPIMFGTLFQQLYNAADVIVVGKYCGADAIAAVGGSSGMMINLAVSFFVGISSGVTVVISRLYGAKDFESLKKAVGTSVFMALTIGMIFTALGIAFAPKMLKLLNTPISITQDSKKYLYIYFGGIIFTVFYNIGSAILRALGDSKRPLYYLIICCAINIVLDVILVTACNLGVAGVGLATVTAQGVSAVLVFRALLNINSEIKFDMASVKPNKNLLSGILWTGLPTAIQGLMNSLSGMVMTFAINEFGVTAMAGNTAYAKLDSIFWMISTAFSVTTATFVAQNIGAGEKNRMKKGIRICFLFDFVLSGILSLFFLIFGGKLFYLFTNDESVILAGMQVLKAIAPYYAIVALYEVTSSALRGIGYVIVPMTINIIGLCGLRIAWVYLIPSYIPELNSLYGVILSCPVSWAFTAAATCVCYAIKMKKFDKFTDC